MSGHVGECCCMLSVSYRLSPASQLCARLSPHRPHALQADEIAVAKSSAEEDLAQAKPALEAAVAALNSITPKDITALKALKNPPDVIKRIFDTVLLLRWAGWVAAEWWWVVERS